MSRMRPLPPDIFTDEDLMQLPIPVRLTAIGLRLHADDAGRETTNPLLLKASIYPATSEISEDDLIEHMLLLDDAGYLAIYLHGDRTYYQVIGWPALSHGKASKHPPPPENILQRIAGSPLENFSAWEREGGGEGVGPDGVLLSPFCRVHQPNGTPNDCRACGRARLAHEHRIRVRRAAREGKE